MSTARLYSIPSYPKGKACYEVVAVVSGFSLLLAPVLPGRDRSFSAEVADQRVSAAEAAAFGNGGDWKIVFVHFWSRDRSILRGVLDLGRCLRVRVGGPLLGKLALLCACDPGTSTPAGPAGLSSTSLGAGGSTSTEACDAPSLVWKTGRKTSYTSYPDPNSEECIVYNGCMWAGQFAHCNGTYPEAWVAEHNIAAVFPDQGLAGHDLCIRSGDSVMIVTAIDTCGDSDCDGCCTANRGDADALIDLESYTNARWGLPDAALKWADLGPNPEACVQ